MAVFKGSDLGKAYGAKALTERFGQADQPLKPATHFKTAAPKQTYLKTAPATDYLKTGALDKTLQALMGKNQGDGTPLTPRRKKRKKQEQGMQL